MATLMVVESPAKAKKIGGFLGSDYVVLASYGHVRDLPGSGEEDGELVPGVGRNFETRYEVPDKSRSAVARLKEAARSADRIILATDPDREGEAIAWHLKEILRAGNPDRVTYQEISEAAVRKAIAAPRKIDMKLVQAQEARRVLDRIVGYAVSPILSRQAGEKLSAGRVQSPALRLTVEREREIRAFQQRDHYGAELTFAGGWKATWVIKPHLQAGQTLCLDQAGAAQAAAMWDLEVVEFEDGRASEAPPPPFITSTLQQEASKRLRIKVKEVMDLAQALFDAGHITYHRVDFPNFAADTQAAIRAYAEGAGLPVAKEARTWKAKAGAQEAHEATRPVNIACEEAGATYAERELYRLIRARALASQLADAVYATRRARLQGSEPIKGVVPQFDATGRQLVEAGWRSIYAGDAKEEESEDDEDSLNNPIPKLERGSRIRAESGRVLAKKTRPPTRFTESGLVKELENRGIGRPSTYASIIETLTGKSYVIPEGSKVKYLVPTKTGEAIVDALVGKCRFVDYDFTAGLEEELDQVAAGYRPYSAVVGTAWRQLEGELEQLKFEGPATPEHPCPTCGKALRRKKGASGFFWGCSGYPDCRETRPDNRGKPGEKRSAAAATEYHCQVAGCGAPLVRRTGATKPSGKGKDRKPARNYDFFACTAFPACKAAYEVGADGTPVVKKP